MTRRLQRLIATTDFHSAFGHATPLLAHLSAVRPDTLVMDSGDFFEGTGYYRLGGGTLERSVLLALYDVIAPGNHGWPHYVEPELHRITVCANAYGEGDRRLFRPVDVRRFADRATAVTAVIGPQAFNAIPHAQRVGQRVIDPAHALRELRLTHREVASWIVLSHSGFEEDLRLADACPFIDAIFSGHCHSSRYGPVRRGKTTVLKGYELGSGYACAEPLGHDWTARVSRFPEVRSSRLPSELGALQAQVSATARKLSVALGPVRGPYRHTALDRRALLTDIADRLRADARVDAVLLNETALRTTWLDDTLTRGDLLAVEPSDNRLVRAVVPRDFQHSPDRLVAHLTAYAGPIVAAPLPPPPRVRTILTTGYLADALTTPADAITSHWLRPSGMPSPKGSTLILTGPEIAAAAADGRLRITPFDLAQVNPNSYNVRLGSTLLVYTDEELDPHRPNRTRKVEISEQGLVLEPGQLYLGHTVERVGSDAFVPLLFGRSSVGRLGLFVEITAPIGDIGFYGQWTLMLSPIRPLRVYAGMKIGQIMFFVAVGPITPYTGKYQAAEGPQASAYWHDLNPAPAVAS